MSFEGFVDGVGPLPPSPLVGCLAVADVDLAGLPEGAGPLRLVVTGGAGQVSGPVALAERRWLALARVDVAVRDLDDPAGNVGRYLAVADVLPDATDLHVRVSGPLGPAWLRALDLLAAVEAVVALPTTGADLEGWVDAVLDRELRVSLVGGSAAQAVAALTTVARLWGDPGDLAAARRWCTCWLADDPVAAVAELEGYQGTVSPNRSR